MSGWFEPDTMAIIDRVEAAFRELTKARNRVSRCTREDSLAAARKQVIAAEAEYRKVAAERDEFVEIRKAQRMQRGEDHYAKRGSK